ncbi:nuclear protein DGCR14 [Amylostereum chailletii]|nr:nuclear protein DGCR14 [Amylostereum chailletii]
MAASTSTTETPARSLNRQVILDEDKYTAALSHIIARDFFPSLVHLDATNSYLDALSSQDPQTISDSVRRLEEISTPATRRRPWQTPSETPYFGAGPSDTPLRTPRDDSAPPAKRARYDTDMSLDDFQARYTSEDNASFTEILDDENKQRQQKYGWAWDAQKRVEAQRDRMIEVRERALIEASPAPGVRERMKIELPTPAGLITAGGENELGHGDAPRLQNDGGNEGASKEMVVKDNLDGEEQEVVDVMAPKKDTRPAGVDGWKFKTRNALMFSPDADVSPYDPTLVSTSKTNLKVIKHGNTRLDEQEEDASATRGRSEPPSPTRSRIDAAIAGTPYRPRSPGDGNFTYVPNLPSPTPSELGPAAVKQLMTWGTLAGTPRVLSQSDDPAETPDTPFRIAGPSARETLSHRLSTTASKSLRTKASLLGIHSRRKGDMGPPSMTPRRAEAPGALTPAAKRLLDRTTMGTAATRRAEAMGRLAGWEGKKEKDLNRVRWTPTPSPVTRR